MTSKFCLFIIVIFLSFTLKTNAKNSPIYPDAGSWNTFSLDYVLNKKWTFLFAEELRLRENYSRLNLFYTNVGFEYQINKKIKTSLVYRWTNKYLDENKFSFRHRLMWDITYKHSFKNFDISYRHRLQVENRDLLTSLSGKIPEWYSRHKIGISHNISKKWSTAFSTEMRYQLHDPRNLSSDNTWHRIRFQLGAEYKINSVSKFGFYYLVQNEFNITAPEDIYITGLEYSLKLGK